MERKAIIVPSRAFGRVLAPPSKSMAHRMLMGAGLSEAKCGGREAGPGMRGQGHGHEWAGAWGEGVLGEETGQAGF